MMWAACTLAFFGFLWIGEMTVLDLSSYDPQVHLSISDTTFDHSSAPTVMFVNIKASKTHPFRKGVTQSLGRTYHLLCPVAAMAAYFQVRGTNLSRAFHYKNGEPLTRRKFVDYLWRGLVATGIDHTKYNSHSFRIGAATTAAAKRIEDSIIKTLGQWESAA